MFLTWTGDMTTSLLANITGLINDLSPSIETLRKYAKAIGKRLEVHLV